MYATALPVRSRNIRVETLRAPVVEAVVAATGDADPILDGATIEIRGRNFSGDDSVDVFVDDTKIPIPPGAVTDTRLTVALPSLQAGIHGLVVRRELAMGAPPVDHDGWQSTVAPFVLTPKIQLVGGTYDITPSAQSSRVVNGQTYDSADLKIGFLPAVGADQRVSLMLNHLAPDGRAYTFDATPGSAAGATQVTIRAVDVIPGPYLVRLQIDDRPDAARPRPDRVLRTSGDPVSTNVETNQRALTAELDALAERVAAYADDGAAPEPTATEAESSPVLDALSVAFGLSGFERDLLLLCAGVELDSRFARLCQQASADPDQRGPTFALALAVLPNAHWSALAPAAPLRRWRLLELEPGETLTTSPLRIDERVLHHLTGIDYLDPRLACVIVPVEAPTVLPESHEQAARRTASCCGTPPGVGLVSGADRETRRSVIAAGVASVGLRLYALGAADVPVTPEERDALARLWERDAILGSATLADRTRGRCRRADPAPRWRAARRTCVGRVRVRPRPPARQPARA